jgi:predicted NBD/HSP70 family sugar kinase
MPIDSAAVSRLSTLQMIRRHGPISRVELVDLLQMSKGAVTEITAELIASGMIGEEVSAIRDRGRPRILLDIRSANAAVVSATLGSRGLVDISLVDLSGNLLQSVSVPQGNHATLASLFGWIGDSIDAFLQSLSIARATVACVAVAIPGIVETSAGVLHRLTSFPDRSFPVAAVMTERLGLPVIIENDLDCLARAQHWFGEGPAQGDFTIVYQGLAVGMAQYSNGLPRTGVEGVNSEFGHVKTDFSDDARLCFCGACGCLTAYASSLGIAWPTHPGQYGSFPRIGLVKKTASALLATAATGDADAMAIFANVGRHLGRALANYINIFDPRMILIRMEDHRMPGLIRNELEATLARHAISTLLERTSIEIAAVMPDWQAKGTAALALEQAYLGAAVKKFRDKNKVAADAIIRARSDMGENT